MKRSILSTMKHTIEWLRKGVLITMIDELTGDDVHQISERLNADSRYDSLRYQIWDFTKVNEINIKAGDVEKIAAFDRASTLTNPNIKLAAVSTDETIQTLTSLYQAIMMDSPWETKIFLSLDEAQNWVM